LIAVTVWALPISIVAGLFGMNVEGSRWLGMLSNSGPWWRLLFRSPLAPDGSHSERGGSSYLPPGDQPEEACAESVWRDPN